jgi:drug/metabolite transporter (DMT)-like permease
MIAAAAGITAAIAWAISSLCSSRSSRAIGPWPVVAWVMVVGLIASTPLLIAGGAPNLDREELAWFAVSGLGNILGLACLYAAMRTLDVSIPVAISAGGGAIAALIGIATGSRASLLMVAGILLVTWGVLAATTPAAPRDDGPAPADDARGGPNPGYLWACAAALLFAGSFFGINQLATTQPLGWAVVGPRIFGVVLVAVPLAIRGRMPIDFKVAPLVVGAGLAELAGFIALALGSRVDLVVTDVFASQYPLVTMLGAFLLLQERLHRRQRWAVAQVAAGVAIIALAG